MWRKRRHKKPENAFTLPLRGGSGAAVVGSVVPVERSKQLFFRRSVRVSKTAFLL
jgi:hypothetical protein